MHTDGSHNLNSANVLALLTGALLGALALFNYDPSNGSPALATAFWISAGLNTPHFLISIDLFYRRKIRTTSSLDLKHHFAAWIFPLIFFTVILLAPGSRQTDQVIQNLHRVTTLAILWHFARQSFGVLLLQIRQYGITVGHTFRQAMQWHLLFLAGAQWLFQNTSNREVTYFGLGFTAFGLPTWSVWITLAGSACFLFKGLKAAYQNRHANDDVRIIPRSAWMTLLCTWAWLAPLIEHPLYIMMLPALHSIQHLSFALPLRARLDANTGIPRRTQGLQLVLLILGGFAFLHAVVPWLDSHYPLLGGAVGLQGWQYTMATFFNLHHYTIEHALWSGGQGDLKPVLLRPAQALVNSAG